MGATIENKYALGNQGGRPTKYNDDILEAARDYLNGDYEQFGVIPTLERLALVLGVCSETIKQWEKDENKIMFSAIVKGVRNLQADLLMNKCLTNEFNSRTGNLLLAKHGYVNKSESDNKYNVKAEVGASQELLDRVAQIQKRIMNADKTGTE